MISDKERQVQDSLANKEYREALAVEHVNTTLAIQIRKMREHRQWSQSDLAGLLGKHQETISQWENPDYGRHSITTLKALAAVFDVALLVKFIPFSELVKDMVNLSDNRLSPPSYVEEQNHAVTSVSAASYGMDIFYPNTASEVVFAMFETRAIPSNIANMAGTITVPYRQGTSKDVPRVREIEKEGALV